MRFFQTLLVMAGIAAAFTGLFLVFVKNRTEGCGFPCTEGSFMSDIIGSALWFTIAIILWALAGVLSWMQRRFDRMEI